MFNARFYNPEFYSKNPPGQLLLDYETNRETPDVFLQDVVNFCLQTDVCKSLNVSVMDLMGLDLPTYTFIKEKVNSALEEKAKVAEKMRVEAARQNTDNWIGRHERR